MKKGPAPPKTFHKRGFYDKLLRGSGGSFSLKSSPAKKNNSRDLIEKRSCVKNPTSAVSDGDAVISAVVAKDGTIERVFDAESADIVRLIVSYLKYHMSARLKV